MPCTINRARQEPVLVFLCETKSSDSRHCLHYQLDPGTEDGNQDQATQRRGLRWRHPGRLYTLVDASQEPEDASEGNQVDNWKALKAKSLRTALKELDA